MFMTLLFSVVGCSLALLHSTYGLLEGHIQQKQNTILHTHKPVAKWFIYNGLKAQACVFIPRICSQAYIVG